MRADLDFLRVPADGKGHVDGGREHRRRFGHEGFGFAILGVLTRGRGIVLFVHGREWVFFQFPRLGVVR